jgi:uncharacterized phage protein (TIGR02218 family)
MPISLALAAHLVGPLTTVATYFRLTRRDGVVMGFTDHNRDLPFESVTHLANSAYSRSQIASNSDLKIDNFELDGILDAAAIDADDIRAGLYYGAPYKIGILNWNDLTMGDLVLKRGTIAKITLKDNTFVAEGEGLAGKLKQRVVKLILPLCNVDVFSPLCGVDPAAFTETGTVTAITVPRKIFTATITGARPAGFFDDGLITWSTGGNTTIPIEVTSDAPGLTLFDAVGRDIEIGDAFTITAGCNKQRLGDCKIKYNNVVNYRGTGDFARGINAALQGFTAS